MGGGVTFEMSLWGLGPPPQQAGGLGARVGGGALPAPGAKAWGGQGVVPALKGALCRTKGPIESTAAGGARHHPPPPNPAHMPNRAPLCSAGWGTALRGAASYWRGGGTLGVIQHSPPHPPKPPPPGPPHYLFPSWRNDPGGAGNVATPPPTPALPSRGAAPKVRGAAPKQRRGSSGGPGSSGHTPPPSPHSGKASPRAVKQSSGPQIIYGASEASCRK